MRTDSISFVRPLFAVVAALFLAAAMLLVAPPAQAHDELLSADPAADTSVEAMPEALTLTFSGLISSEPAATEVQVTDAAGTSVVAGDPSVQDNVVTQPLSPDATGDITVLWKVVSSDGHPISGEYSFTVTAPAPTETAEPTTSAEPTQTAEPTESAEATETASATPSPEASADQDSSSAAWPWIVGGVVVAGIVAAILYLVISRSRQKRALAESHPHTER
jgi:methionine-rich copper-binding protein CopC